MHLCVCDVEGVQGILSAYQMCLSQVTLYGPTNFAPIIYHAAQFAAAAKSEPTPKVWFFMITKIIRGTVVQTVDCHSEICLLYTSDAADE